MSDGGIRDRDCPIRIRAQHYDAKHGTLSQRMLMKRMTKANWESVAQWIKTQEEIKNPPQDEWILV